MGGTFWNGKNVTIHGYNHNRCKWSEKTEGIYFFIKEKQSGKFVIKKDFK